MLYPYAYLLWLSGIAVVNGAGWYDSDIAQLLFHGLFIVYNIYVVIIAIYNAVVTARDGFTARDAAILNAVVKGVQIPAYIFYFVMGLLGTLMSVWGIGLILLAIIVDVLTIVLSGISAIGCAVKMVKEGRMQPAFALLAGLASFVFCIDIIAAIIYLVCGFRKK